MEIKVLMILGLYPREEEKVIISKSMKGRQDAANKFQWNLVNGFNDVVNDTTIINAPYIDSYPNGYKDLIYRGGSFSHNGRTQDVSISFINLPFISSFSKFYSSKKEIKKWIIQNRGINKAVILYAMNSYMGLCAKYIKSISPETKVCMVVPDLPEFAYSISDRSFLYKYLIKKEIRRSYNLLNYADCLVGLTKQMQKRLIPSLPFCVVDSIIDNAANPLGFEEYVQNKKIITYTGTLSPKYGIKDLVESFMLVDDPDMQLVICGAGHQEMENFIRRCSSKDSRIIYKGLVPQDRVLNIQKNSFLLVNPRKNDSEYTAYSFPSKIAEYMTTGVPVAIYRLDGMSEDYYDKTFQFDQYESLSNAIEAISKIDRKKLWETAHAAYMYVAEEKSPRQQCKKILELICALY